MVDKRSNLIKYLDKVIQSTSILSQDILNNNFKRKIPKNLT